ncbi:SGNH/GDSL hydrolase family protein [Legionella sainthelensi]|uniref:SGNH/GDSL hydrolase family protein n=1 Tax=Legionella sainthelensi TaxID=28087 RepID=UPI000E205D09|nr:SGNH/GDSL hydrolase family protein [Legionella sainthelensi]
MGLVQNSSLSIGEGYPRNTGRLKKVIGTSQEASQKVALMGDSTIDNGYWVDKKIPYAEKSHTVTHQTALALANNAQSGSYYIGNFAVDGATTTDLMRYCRLDKVLPTDKDHLDSRVHQLESVTEWKPDVAVLSVAGNNYREALANTLINQINYPKLLLRITPESAKPIINSAFQKVKEKILLDYKMIIDQLVEQNPQLSRIVLLSQYYPSITEFTPYFIYTGFSHLARSEGKSQGPFPVVEETMNELYREILAYAITKGKEIVFVDVTSSLNPLGGKHSHQIEPNEQGSAIMGRLIAKAVHYNFPKQEAEEDKKSIARLYLNADEKHIQSQMIQEQEINKFTVKRITQFISENRYRHLGLLFSPSSNLGARYEGAYHTIMGKQFDAEYKGLFAFGLLDLSLITVMASYLWRVAVNENVPSSFRVMAGTVAAPVLLGKMVLGVSLMLALAVPILGYDKAVNLFTNPTTQKNKNEPLPETDELVPALH